MKGIGANCRIWTHVLWYFKFLLLVLSFSLVTPFRDYSFCLYYSFCTGVSPLHCLIQGSSQVELVLRETEICARYSCRRLEFLSVLDLLRVLKFYDDYYSKKYLKKWSNLKKWRNALFWGTTCFEGIFHDSMTREQMDLLHKYFRLILQLIRIIEVSILYHWFGGLHEFVFTSEKLESWIPVKQSYILPASVYRGILENVTWCLSMVSEIRNAKCKQYRSDFFPVKM